MTENIVVGVDGREGGRAAIALARALAPRGRLVLAGVWSVERELLVLDDAGPAARCAARLAEEAAHVPGAEVRAVAARSVSRGLHQVAEEEDASLLVVGATGHHGAGRVLLGDDARATLHAAPCAVAIAPLGHTPPAGGLRRIIVGWDGGPDAEAALGRARGLARSTGAQLELLQVVPLAAALAAGATWGWAPALAAEVVAAAEAQAVREAQERIEAVPGVTGRAVLGVVADELRAAAERADLLVVGSRGHGPLRRLVLGSTATALAGRTACPLVVVPRPEQGALAEPASAAALALA